MNTENKKWLTEYEVFLKAETTEVSKLLTEKVFLAMRDLLKPSAWTVFFKIAAIHFVVGLLSLSVCHQFGMNPFGTEFSLDSWFMNLWGHHACMVFCGILFASITFFCAGYFLSIEEIRALKKTKSIQALALGFISLSIFSVFGAELILTMAGLWLFGALLGSIAATEMVWLLKKRTAYGAGQK